MDERGASREFQEDRREAACDGLYYWIAFAGPYQARVWYCLPALDRESAEASGWTRLENTLGLQDRRGDDGILKDWICLSVDRAGGSRGGCTDNA